MEGTYGRALKQGPLPTWHVKTTKAKSVITDHGCSDPEYGTHFPTIK